MKTILRYSKNSPVTIFIFCLMLFGGLITACSNSDDDESGSGNSTTVSYEGNFVASGSSVTTSATGTATGTYNSTTMTLAYSANWSGLSSDISAMHFHNSSGVIVGIDGFTTGMTGNVSGSVVLTAEQASQLASGGIFIQIHTTGYPGGEILATLTKKSTGGSGGSGGGGGY